MSFAHLRFSLFNLSRFDEPTQLTVSMTGSHTRCASRGISRCLAEGRFPEHKPREQASQLDRYLPYVYGRWAAGYHHMACLFRELVEQGYKDSYASVRDTILRLLPQGRQTSADTQSGKQAPVFSRQAIFLLLRQPEKLEADEQETLIQLLQLDRSA